MNNSKNYEDRTLYNTTADQLQKLGIEIRPDDNSTSKNKEYVDNLAEEAKQPIHEPPNPSPQSASQAEENDYYNGISQ